MANTGEAIRKRGFPDELLKVSSEELVEFMSSLGEGVGCPVCGGDMGIMAAAILDDNNNHAGFSEKPAIIGMPVDERPELGLEFKTPAFGASCHQCGFISYHMFAKFIAWKNKNEKTKHP